MKQIDTARNQDLHEKIRQELGPRPALMVWKGRLLLMNIGLLALSLLLIFAGALSPFIGIAGVVLMSLAFTGLGSLMLFSLLVRTEYEKQYQKRIGQTSDTRALMGLTSLFLPLLGCSLLAGVLGLDSSSVSVILLIGCLAVLSFLLLQGLFYIRKPFSLRYFYKVKGWPERLILGILILFVLFMLAMSFDLIL